MSIRNAGALGGALLVSASLSPAFAGGFRIEGQDARAIGLSLAGSPAIWGDAGFAFYNPAALGGIAEADYSSTISGLVIKSDYDVDEATLLGAVPAPGNYEGRKLLADAIIPTSAIGVRVSDRLVAGLSLNAPFGLKSQYDRQSALRYHAQESELKTIAATASAAFTPTPSLSVAAGVRIQYADLSFTSATDAAGLAAANALGAFTPGTEDVYAAVSLDDFGFGFVAGVQIRPVPGVTLGASYSSKIDHDLDGNAAFDLAGSPSGTALAGLGLFQSGPATSRLSTPAIFDVGASLAANDRLTFLASVSLTRWSDFEQITIAFDNPAQPDEVLTQDWRDSFAYSAGAEYELSQMTTLRAGVMFDESPGNDAFASPRITAAEHLWFSAGATQKLFGNWSVDGAVAVIYFDEFSYDIPGTLPETQVRGALEATGDATAYILSARLRRNF